jgi:ADP-ribosylglycohydrolase
MHDFLRDTNRFPLSDYFSANVPDNIREKYEITKDRPFIEFVECMPEDDDTNYTIAALGILQKYGRDFTPEDVAEFWMKNLPILRTCTAEQVAYSNFCHNISPPASATFRNPYREWIGAQIRADFYGYIMPEQTERAASLVWRDACISHVKNGIYGAMWVAAMLASAFATDDIKTVIRAGLAQIPSTSRLHEAICEVMEWHAQGVSYDEAAMRVHRLWDENNPYDWCHTISNAMIVATGLLWGEMDFEKSICRAVQTCFDTDCNGATVGSIVGLIVGAKNIPDKWSLPIRDTIETGLSGKSRLSLSQLVKDTLRVIEAMHK